MSKKNIIISIIVVLLFSLIVFYRPERKNNVPTSTFEKIENSKLPVPQEKVSDVVPQVPPQTTSSIDNALVSSKELDRIMEDVVRKKDPRLCSQVRMSGLVKDSCYLVIAVLTLDVNLCNSMVDTEKRADCTITVNAIVAGNVPACYKVQEQFLREKCKGEAEKNKEILDQGKVDAFEKTSPTASYTTSTGEVLKTGIYDAGGVLHERFPAVIYLQSVKQESSDMTVAFTVESWKEIRNVSATMRIFPDTKCKYIVAGNSFTTDTVDLIKANEVRAFTYSADIGKFNAFVSADPGLQYRGGAEGPLEKIRAIEITVNGSESPTYKGELDCTILPVD